MKIKTFLAGLLLTIFLAPVAAYASATGVEIEKGLLSYTSYVHVEETEPTVFITTARLNLRPEPSTNNTRIALIPQGRRVEVLNFGCGEWFEVYHNGQTGFMYAAHLRETTGNSAFGTVELLHWSEARHVMTIGTVATLVDVRTGLSWEIASFSNGNHADIETITAEDTAIKRQAFGGSWTWTPRPVLVLINGRTLAASVNGMPHAGSTRSGNNMNGHVCLHFLGSTTHRPAAQHVRDHQNAVMEAYNTATSWQVVTSPAANEYSL